MIVSLIAAMDRKRGIGIGNQLPWRLPADLKRFRELTMGHHIIVGRKTFESIGKPLPGRQMIIITHDRGYSADGCLIVHSLEEAIDLARERAESEVFVCGGADIYAQAISLADVIYLTLVEAEVAADVFFPKFDEHDWKEQEISHHPADEKNQYPFTFKVMTRKNIRNAPTCEKPAKTTQRPSARQEYRADGLCVELVPDPERSRSCISGKTA